MVRRGDMGGVDEAHRVAQSSVAGIRRESEHGVEGWDRLTLLVAQLSPLLAHETTLEDIPQLELAEDQQRQLWRKRL